MGTIDQCFPARNPMITPLVSLLVATRNGARRIPKALNAALAQTYHPIEILIADDASTDDTPAVLASYQKQYPDRIRIMHNKKNLGVAATSAQLLNEAKGVYAARLDDDDYYTDQKKLENQVRYLEQHPDCMLVGTWCTLSFPDGSSTLRKSPTENGALRHRIYQGTNPFVNSTVLFRCDAARRYGGFRAEHHTTEDLDLFLRLGAHGTMAVLPENTLIYTVSSGSLSGKKRGTEAREMLRVLHRHRTAYRDAYIWYPATLLRIMIRQLVALLIPRSLVMRIKYRSS